MSSYVRSLVACIYVRLFGVVQGVWYIAIMYCSNMPQPEVYSFVCKQSQVRCRGSESAFFSCGYTLKATGGTCRRMATVSCVEEADEPDVPPPDAPEADTPEPPEEDADDEENASPPVGDDDEENDAPPEAE